MLSASRSYRKGTQWYDPNTCLHRVHSVDFSHAEIPPVGLGSDISQEKFYWEIAVSLSCCQYYVMLFMR